MKQLVVETTGGVLRGVEKETCNAYLGIPYGTCERFMPPKPYSWKGILPCVSYGSKAIGTTFYRTIPKNQPVVISGSENCLNLNVWTPKDAGFGKKLPVVVYIHGGAYQIGSNSNPIESGENFMKDEPEMVYVSVNYRLGVLGFLEWGEILGEKYEGSANNGFRDTVLAIQWVHENIAKFGGDPENVTLMGLSAGSKTVATLTICPPVRGMFRQIICESGAVQSLRTIETARKVAQRYLGFLGTEDPEVILSMDAYQMVAAQIQMSNSEGSTCLYGPVFEEGLFPKDWKKDFEEGKGWKGNALMGSCRNELYASFQGAFLKQAAATVDGLFGIFAPCAWEEYNKLAGGRELTEEEQSNNWVKVASDFMYRTYNDRYSSWLSSHGSNVWNYSMEFGKAFHTYGFSLVMGNYPKIGLTADNEDAKKIHNAIKQRYVNFIVSGDPNRDGELAWPKWTEENKVKYQFNVEDRVMEDASADTITSFPEYMFEL